MGWFAKMYTILAFKIIYLKTCFNIYGDLDAYHSRTYRIYVRIAFAFLFRERRERWAQLSQNILKSSKKLIVAVECVVEANDRVDGGSAFQTNRSPWNIGQIFQQYVGFQNASKCCAEIRRLLFDVQFELAVETRFKLN